MISENLAVFLTTTTSQLKNWYCIKAKFHVTFPFLKNRNLFNGERNMKVTIKVTRHYRTDLTEK
ncbi:MAG: hypothetical protein LBI18_03640 [Planctomycetaceae bacterium]|nr:hypothetical protein [Planctomycetaceae bacterium]